VEDELARKEDAFKAAQDQDRAEARARRAALRQQRELQVLFFSLSLLIGWLGY
jgi:hypothetical protein